MEYVDNLVSVCNNFRIFIYHEVMDNHFFVIYKDMDVFIQSNDYYHLNIRVYDLCWNDVVFRIVYHYIFN